MMRSVHWCVGLQGESSDWEHWSVHLDSDLLFSFSIHILHQKCWQSWKNNKKLSCICTLYVENRCITETVFLFVSLLTAYMACFTCRWRSSASSIAVSRSSAGSFLPTVNIVWIISSRGINCGIPARAISAAIIAFATPAAFLF